MITNKEIVSKLAKDLLWKDEYEGTKGVVVFDFKSYDCEEDIPTITDDKTYKVQGVAITEDGKRLSIVTDTDKTFDIDFEDETINGKKIGKPYTFEYYLNLMGLYDLLCDVYYETNLSWEIGDFENDFLKIAC